MSFKMDGYLFYLLCLLSSSRKKERTNERHPESGKMWSTMNFTCVQFKQTANASTHRHAHSNNPSSYCASFLTSVGFCSGWFVCLFTSWSCCLVSCSSLRFSFAFSCLQVVSMAQIRLCALSEVRLWSSYILSFCL